MNPDSITPKDYKVDVKYIVYILLFLVLILLTVSLSLGYFLLNAQKSFENSVNSSVSASLLASKQAEEGDNVKRSEASVISSSTQTASKLGFTTNTGTFVSFDYPEEGVISIGSVNTDDKFASVEDIKYIHLKGDYYEVTIAKNKASSINQSTAGDRIEFKGANLEGDCKYLLKGASLDKVIDEIPCGESLQVVKSRVLSPGFAYVNSKPLVLFGHSNDGSDSITSFTSFGSPLGMREIITHENTVATPSNNIILQNMPDSWKNSAYVEFRCNNINDRDTASKCLEIFTAFIDSIEFKK